MQHQFHVGKIEKRLEVGNAVQADVMVGDQDRPMLAQLATLSVDEHLAEFGVQLIERQAVIVGQTE